MPAELIIDIHGESRNCGSLILPTGKVTALRSFEDEKPVWTDAEIRAAILDPDKPDSRKMFGTQWMQNQQSKGSCNGYATAAVLAKARFKRGIRDGLILLSGAFLYSLINGGHDNGSYLHDSMAAIQKYGICPESLVPWDCIYSYQLPPGAYTEAAKHKGIQAYPVQTKQGFRTALAAGYPVIVCVQAGSNFQRLNNQGICGVDYGYGNHAIHACGIDITNGTEVYDTRNSWGLSYGDDGCCYTTWDSFEAPFLSHTFWALASTEEYGI